MGSGSGDAAAASASAKVGNDFAFRVRQDPALESEGDVGGKAEAATHCKIKSKQAQRCSDAEVETLKIENQTKPNKDTYRCGGGEDGTIDGTYSRSEKKRSARLLVSDHQSQNSINHLLVSRKTNRGLESFPYVYT